MKKKKYQHGREMMGNLSMIDPNITQHVIKEWDNFVLENHPLAKSKTVPMEGYNDPVSNLSPFEIEIEADKTDPSHKRGYQFNSAMPSSYLPAQQTGTEIGKDNYMQALKLFKKGGSK